MITMHARQRQTDEQTNEHHGDSTTIRFDERIARKKTK